MDLVKRKHHSLYYLQWISAIEKFTGKFLPIMALKIDKGTGFLHINLFFISTVKIWKSNRSIWNWTKSFKDKFKDNTEFLFTNFSDIKHFFKAFRFPGCSSYKIPSSYTRSYMIPSNHTRIIQNIKLYTNKLNSIRPKQLIPKKLDHCSHSIRTKNFFPWNHTRSYMICMISY